MQRVVLISCVSKKLPYKAKAKDLYLSPWFKMAIEYAKKLNPDKIFMLSAKYGLVGLEEEIETYNEILNSKSAREIKQWAEKVMQDLEKEVDVDKDEVIFLAGKNYRKYLVPKIKNYKIPMHGLPIGKQLSFLKEKLQNE